MTDTDTVTRFAPSPTGDLHLGNARTALFNELLARRAGGRFLLRIEDTDAQRSQEAHTQGLIADLHWLGLHWDAGPDREDTRGPYRQSERASIYAADFAALERNHAVYPCYCSALELELSRRTQLAAGKPPRYAGTCRELTPLERAERSGGGLAPTLRFRVPPGERIDFMDFVHGAQSFLSDDIGDFVVRRADGSAAFFFCNAVDDARMRVTRVLRGEDHLTNTPRQLMILAALGLKPPLYGHVALLVGADGAPLSKRHGASSVREFRARGFTAAAVTNHLFRLGHASAEHGFLTLAQMAQAFDPSHLGRAPARYDEQQLRVWQKEAVQRMSAAEVHAWLGAVLLASLDGGAVGAFIEAVRGNIVLPEDALLWKNIIYGAPPLLAPAEAEIVRSAGASYFHAAAQATGERADLAAILAAVRAATGKTGAALYKPLRLALTGQQHGPELAPLLAAMPAGAARARLERFANSP
ncbi:MAG TPA: glutamate--tRNA ligase [Steroidobacteraceae bacterium]